MTTHVGFHCGEELSLSIPDLLQGSPLFYEVHDKEIEFVLKQCQICEYKANDYIFEQNQQLEFLYLLLEGKVSLTKQTSSTTINIDELEEGDLFGVDVLSDEKSSTIEAKCDKDTFVLRIDFDVLRSLYKKKPALLSILLINITRLLSKRLLTAREKICGIAEITNKITGDEGSTGGSKVQLSEEKPLVYFMEDDEDIRKIGVHYLQKEFRVEAFENPTPVMDLIDEGKLPDLFLTDFMMPELNGIEFMEFLKEEEIDLPVIFVTGVNQFDMAMEALNLGVHTLLEKPFTGDQLILTVKRALRERYLVEFNNDLLSQYQSLFTNLSTILKSLSSQDFSTKINQLLSDTKEQYDRMDLKKQALARLEK